METELQVASIPKDENQRLRALLLYDVLDTEAEKAFDEITELASQICQTPIALVSLIDADRQWFKSKVGLDAQQTHRDFAFCAHAILQQGIFEVEDTFKDERFVDNPLVTGDPKIRFYAGAPLTTPDGYNIGTLCTISDRPMKLSDHQRKALHILSNSVIAQLELRLKIKQLEQSLQLRIDYLSNISHELRTPLNAIVSFSHLLMEHCEREDCTPKTKQYLHHLAFSGDRLLSVINSVLDLNKLEEGMMELTPTVFDPMVLFEQIISMLRPKAEEKSLSLQIDVAGNMPEMVYLDETRVGQIVINLVNNAIKFTPNGRKITIKVHSTKSKLTVAVKDQGIGISKARQPDLFNKFVQVEQSRFQEGTGLGLAISKAIVELMQGSINLVSDEGKGTLVKFQLPLPTLPEHAAIATKIRNDKVMCTPQAKILVVEDNDINREVAAAMLNDIGMTDLDFAEDGETAVAMVDHTTYALILMDIHMPGIDGFEAATQIHQKQPNIPIVALTADVFRPSDKASDRYDMVDFLYKPVERSKLIDIVNRYVCKT